MNLILLIMKKFYCLISVFAVLALSACQNEDDFVSLEQKLSEVEVEATLENGTNSRTSLNEGKVYWEENDALSVFLGNITGQKATIIKESMNDTYAQFKISAGSDVILGGGTEDDENSFSNLAYYPYGETVTVSKQGDNYIVSAVFPAEQSFKDGSFGTNVYPMVAVNDGLNFGFRNVAGMIHIPLKGTATITKVTVESKNHKLSGNYKITASANTVPTMEMGSDATNLITLVCGEEVALNENTALGFDFVLPVGTYEGGDLIFTFYDNNNGYMEFVAANDDKVERSKRTVFSEKTYQVTGYNLDKSVVAWIGSDTYTSISSAVAASQANDVINVKPGTYNEVVNVKGGKNVTIQPANEGDEVTIAGIDHQSNDTPSTVVVKNITLDNTLQTEGWFIGTAQNIKPCVGAWGGNFTFEGCKFIVEGTSGKETGVMTWWTTAPALSFKFDDCEFVGYSDHTSARAMQIYGNVNMEVTNCTFKTYKDYSLKYVAKEGNVATFDGNKVYNTENFVQLGSAPYAGSKYTVKINNTTLGDGVSHYIIDNDENQMVYIDGALVASKAEQLAACLTGDEQNIKVVLANDIELPITSLGTITAGSGEYKLGGENTETIMIDLNNNKLNITTTYWSAIGAKNNDATITIKDGTMTSTGNSADTWNAWDVRFSNCNYVIENVIFEKAVALDNAGKSATLKGVTIKDNHNKDTYALWITAEGQTVTLEDNCVIDMLECIDGRGIKIDEQYVDSPQKVTLKVSKTTFSTEEKAAILVKSKAGADITLENIDIQKVKADMENAVWCDADAADYNGLITVTGGTKKVEGQ